MSENTSQLSPSSTVEAGPVSGEHPSSRQRRPARIFFPCVAISLVVSLMSAGGAVCLYDRYFAQKVVAVDLQGFLKRQKDDYLDGRISGEDLQRRMDELEAFVDQIPANRSVILSDVVVRNVRVLKP
ncbi:hypothetical protein [Geothermobacter hydrogeniphilus]|uniref:Uncharacterized protein n=1 Tax=Geothermobacter hydrogeniphilus TaxID=1969733 RepID=A0A1X0XX81_9BACT|nr:hypothetical protein [Geothermobacter hydrogeniphilus]ORJ57504.1 hypothetical protein B5V00_13725 [Geothermobacter hydrogeniphilus]